MSDKSNKQLRLRPDCRGKLWVPVRLPKSEDDWSHGGEKSIAVEGKGTGALVKVLANLNDSNAWKWPRRAHYFFSDLHGDPAAFAASLVASGGVKKTGPKPRNFQLSKVGKRANFIIGGDCFDKGPSSLELLRSVRHLMNQGARVRVLAGNHDIRVLFGIRVVGKVKNTSNEHFFVRTGEKIIPLLKEIWRGYLKGRRGTKGIPGEATCRERLFPRDSWFHKFSEVASNDILPAQRKSEISKVSKKLDRFEQACREAKLNLRQVYAAVEKWKELFLQEDGEFYWFFKNMRLCYRSGSFLFVHAGVDDAVAAILAQGGASQLNQDFRKAVKRAPFDFYYGSLCNAVRADFRESDRSLTKAGVRNLHRAGITAIIHGHRNLYHGQRLYLRKSLINFECDTSLDRHTRKVENVRGRGASVTIVDPRGYVLGISSDYPKVKVFHPVTTHQRLVAGIKNPNPSPRENET